MDFASMSAHCPTKSDESSNFPVPPQAADGTLCPAPTSNVIQLLQSTARVLKKLLNGRALVLTISASQRVWGG